MAAGLSLTSVEVAPEEYKKANRWYHIKSGIYWGVCLVFLLFSAPHIAYYFGAYQATDIWSQGVAWGLGIIIDAPIYIIVLGIAWLFGELTRDFRWGLLIGTIVLTLVLLLCALYSWHANTIYTAHFRNAAALSGTESVLGSQFDAQITAAIPFFGLIFSFVAPLLLRKPIIVKQEQQLSLDDIEQQQHIRLAHIRMENMLKAEKRKGNFLAQAKAQIIELRSQPQQQEEQQMQQEVPTPVQSQLLAEPEPVAKVQEVKEEVVEEPSVNEAITEPIPVAEVPGVPVVLSLPISEPLTPLPQVRITKPLEQEVLTIPGFTTRNTRYTLDDVTYDSLSNVVNRDWRIYRSITLAVLDKLVKQGKLVPYVKLVQCGEKTVRTIAISDDSARAVYIALGKALPESLRLTAPACVSEV